MANRWSILAVLFTVRTTMAIQYQTVAALSPLIMESYGLGLTEIGILIGLYLAPGIAIAYPGGAIGRRFGDRRTVAAGMVLMIAGGVLMTLGTSWEAQVVGRVIAGTGGVVLSVLMSKMVQDWFVGREIATAMGIFVNSWPVGIAVALLVLPRVAEAGGLTLAAGAVTVLVTLGLALLHVGYQPPDRGAAAPAPPRAGIGRGALYCVLLAGLIWGLYNGAVGMVFGFGPAMLAERGASLTEASSSTSLALWLIAASVPLGGVLADRTGRRDLILVGSVVAFAIAMIAAAFADAPIAAFVALGLIGGLAAGPIMSLPADVLAPETRAQGMGLFFTLFYIMFVIAPTFAGWVSERVGSASAAFLLGAAMLLVCPGLLAVFRAVRRRPAAVAA